MPSAAGYKDVMAHIPKGILALAEGKAKTLGEAKVPLPADAPHESWNQAEANIQSSMAAAVKKATAEHAADAARQAHAAEEARQEQAGTLPGAAAAVAELHNAAEAAKKAQTEDAKKKAQVAKKASAGKKHSVSHPTKKTAPKAAKAEAPKAAKAPKAASPKKSSVPKKAESKAAPKTHKVTPPGAKSAPAAKAAQAAPVKSAAKAKVDEKKAAKSKMIDEMTHNFDAVEGTKNGEGNKKAAAPVGKKAPSRTSRRAHVNAHKPVDDTPKKNAQPPTKKSAAKANGDAKPGKTEAPKKKAPTQKSAAKAKGDAKPAKGEAPKKKAPKKKANGSKKAAAPRNVPNSQDATWSKLPPLKPNSELGEDDEMQVPKKTLDLSKFEKMSPAMKAMQKLAADMGIHEESHTAESPIAKKKERKVDLAAKKASDKKAAIMMADLKKNGEHVASHIQLPSLSIKLPKLEFSKAELQKKVVMPKVVTAKPAPTVKDIAPKTPKTMKQQDKELGEEVKQDDENVLKDLLPSQHKNKMWMGGGLTFGGHAINVDDDEELIQEADPSDDERESNDDESEDGTHEDSVAAHHEQPFFAHKHKPLFKHYRFANHKAHAEHREHREHRDLGESEDSEKPKQAKVPEAAKEDEHERPSPVEYEPEPEAEPYDPVQDMLDANGWSRSRLMTPEQIQRQQMGVAAAPRGGFQITENDGATSLGEDGDDADEEHDLGESSDIADHEQAPHADDVGNEGEISSPDEDENPDLGESDEVTAAPAIDMEHAPVHLGDRYEDAAGDETAAGDAETNLEAGDAP